MFGCYEFMKISSMMFAAQSIYGDKKWQPQSETGCQLLAIIWQGMDTNIFS